MQKLASLTKDTSLPNVVTFHAPRERVKAFDPVEEAAKIVAPSWPLQNLVAVNPFWFNRDKHITAHFHELSPLLGQYLFMPLGYYQNRLRSGEINLQDLEKAIQYGKELWADLPEHAESYTSASHAAGQIDNLLQTAFEALPDSQGTRQKIYENLARYCSAYFDDRQALAGFPWRSNSFWDAWLEGQKFDRSLQVLGLRQVTEDLETIRSLSSRECIHYIFEQLGLEDLNAQLAYCQKLLVTMMGWASQFKYIEWQKSLGYGVNRHSGLADFLAVRMVYDFIYYKDHSRSHSSLAQQWVLKLSETAYNPQQLSLKFAQHYVWQMAAELASQRRASRLIKKAVPDSGEQGKYQMVFCIDVRSEMLRRHIEAMNAEIQTIGFAGFFGLPLDFKHLDEKEVSHRLPVLISPSYKLGESNRRPKDRDNRADYLNNIFIESYFRNLRKVSIGSFLYVELFGILALGHILSDGLKSLWAKLSGSIVFDRFHTRSDKNPTLVGDAFHPISIDTKVQQAKKILQGLGISKKLGRIIVFCGHGAETTNNPLASALDCGACGGHAGDINARFAAMILNDPEVRKGLAQEGVAIPEDTLFLAAIHETVTDTVVILDIDHVPVGYRQELQALMDDLQKASEKTSAERQTARSDTLDSSPRKRAANWSEVRPEWGLAGNAHFIVAPRSRSKGVNLNSRAFLHDYDWREDEGFQLLEQIMTAPMIVTNWINLGYYSSVVAPDVYGAGNKLLHNITGENAVVEGNGGDLRFGLSHQSIYDGSQFTHEPLKLAVYIEAPKEALENVIKKHALVKELVDNEWLHLLQIDPESQSIFRRRPGGRYDVV